jgi:radical SAM superfamily enzyme YgiQ (UPF0313 family)
MKIERKVKFVLLNPTADLWKVRKGKGPSSKTAVFRFSMLPSLYVCASMPDWIESRIIDEDVESIPEKIDADIVGISFMTFNAARAYELGDHYMRQGKTVIFGGYHPSFMPEEAGKHCNAVCVGEAEVSVPKMMNDWRKGKLKKIYHSGRVDLKGLPIPDRGLLKKRAYIMPNAMNATRGCPNSCDFCSPSKFFEHKHLKRPVKEVIEEIKTLDGRYLIFVDDNLTFDRNYALELFREMEPLRKIWFGQTSIGIAEDEQLLEAAYRSGARGFFIGLESICQNTLDGFNKKFARADRYKKAIKAMHDHGIFIMASVVFGGDEDDPDSFEKTLEFLRETNVDNLQATIYTPFPGTDLHERMKEEGRILDSEPTKYDFSHAVFKPKTMTREDLEEGFSFVMDSFYSRTSIFKRTMKQMRYGSFWNGVRISLALSIGYRNRVRSKGFDRKASLHREKIRNRRR